jgi:hypothetical protein
MCDKVCQWLTAGRWFSLGTPVSCINNTDRHDITEILLTVAFKTITLTLALFTLLFFPFRMVTQTLMIISLCNVAVYAVTGISCHDNRHINGCSIPWYVPSFYKDTFTPVCNNHDLCYYCVCIYILIICYLLFNASFCCLMMGGHI